MVVGDIEAITELRINAAIEAKVVTLVIIDRTIAHIAPTIGEPAISAPTSASAAIMAVLVSRFPSVIIHRGINSATIRGIEDTGGSEGFRDDTVDIISAITAGIEVMAGIGGTGGIGVTGGIAAVTRSRRIMDQSWMHGSNQSEHSA